MTREKFKSEIIGVVKQSVYNTMGNILGKNAYITEVDDATSLLFDTIERGRKQQFYLYIDRIEEEFYKICNYPSLSLDVLEELNAVFIRETIIDFVLQSYDKYYNNKVSRQNNKVVETKTFEISNMLFADTVVEELTNLIKSGEIEKYDQIKFGERTFNLREVKEKKKEPLVFEVAGTNICQLIDLIRSGEIEKYDQIKLDNSIVYLHDKEE